MSDYDEFLCFNLKMIQVEVFETLTASYTDTSFQSQNDSSRSMKT